MMKNDTSGFTLIEICIVITIIGLLVVPLARLYEQYLFRQKLEQSQTSVKESATQINYFPIRIVPGRLPCPSDRRLTPADPRYQREFNNGNCNLLGPGGILATTGWAYAPLPAHNPLFCTADFGFCLAEGNRGDLDGDGYTDPVLIGGIPIRDITAANKYNFSTAQITDAWGSALTYAVTQSQTVGSSYRPGRGVIRALDEHGNPTSGINDDGDYVVISHGPNQVGGFSPTGGRISSCQSTLTGIDNENCNNDSVFVSGLGVYGATGPTYYDDITHFEKSQSGDLWVRDVDSSDNTIMYNGNTGNVGIGTDTPTSRLTVEGIVRANNGVKASEICDRNGDNCFNISAISGGGIIPCTGNTIMKGIYTTATTSGTPPVTTYTTHADCIPAPTFTMPSGSCPSAGQYIHGINSNGSLICLP